MATSLISLRVVAILFGPGSRLYYGREGNTLVIRAERASCSMVNPYISHPRDTLTRDTADLGTAVSYANTVKANYKIEGVGLIRKGDIIDRNPVRKSHRARPP